MFDLYPEERHWWSFNDYRAVLDVVRARAPRRVLEFGPGSSTLALIEGGAIEIDTCEDAPDWAEVYEARLVPRFPSPTYPAGIRLHRYTWGEPLMIPALEGASYDLALIDGPHGTDRRVEVVRYCLDRAAAILLPTEDANRAFMPAVRALAAARGWRVTAWQTGPLSGGFALLEPGQATEIPPPSEAVTNPVAAGGEAGSDEVRGTPSGSEGGTTASKLSRRERRKRRKLAKGKG